MFCEKEFEQFFLRGVAEGRDGGGREQPGLRVDEA